MQLTTVGKEIWKAARKAEQLEEAGAGDSTVKERPQKLKLVEAFRKHGVGWPEIKELVGISRATYYRWKRRLQEEGLKGLAPKPRRPTCNLPTPCPLKPLALLPAQEWLLTREEEGPQ